MGDDVMAFLGRFHPLIVHLPIGFLMMAGLMHYVSTGYSKRFSSLDAGISFVLFWGSLSSIGAMVIGFLLSLNGVYDPDTLFWHQWFGIVLTLLSFVLWYVKRYRTEKKRSVSIMMPLALILVAITGHLGGNLTHGNEYLFQYAPSLIKELVEIKGNRYQPDLNDIDKDSLDVYLHFVQPLLDQKCLSCHGEKRTEGGLSLTNYQEIIKGSENGSIIDVDQPLDSRLINRITLPKHHRKVMPPKGELLSYGEVELIRWWMEKGADSTSKFLSFLPLEESLSKILIRDYGLEIKTVPYYEKIKADKVDNEVMNELRSLGFKLSSLGENTSAISVKLSHDTLSEVHMESLLKVKDQLTWLELSTCLANDALLEQLGEFKHLTRLDLHGNQITDQTIEQLVDLSHLASLNIYNTEVSDLGLGKIILLRSLKKIYIWNSKISESYVREVKNSHSDIEIIGNLYNPNKKSS